MSGRLDRPILLETDEDAACALLRQWHDEHELLFLDVQAPMTEADHQLLSVAKGYADVYIFPLTPSVRECVELTTQRTFVVHDAVAFLRHCPLPPAAASRIDSVRLMEQVAWHDAETPPSPPSGAGTRVLAARAERAVDLRERFFEAAEELLARPRAAELYRLMRSAQPAVVAMCRAGVGFDAPGHRDLVARWEQQLEACLNTLHEHGETDWNSPDQVFDLLAQELGAAVADAWPRDGKNRPCLDDHTLRQRLDPAFCDAYLGYVSAKRLLAYWGEKLQTRVDNDGRIRARYVIDGASTGRFSCSGPSLQCLPRDPALRRLFRARDGHCFVYGDYNQMQLRIVAEVSGDAALLEAYERGDDVHVATAAAINGVGPDEVSDEMRSKAKAINFGFLFGLGPASLRDYARTEFGVTISTHEAREAQQRFSRAYPGLAAWQRWVKDRLYAGKPILTPSGREGWFAPKQWRRALAFPVQGGEAEVVLHALAGLPGLLGAHGAELVAIVHDELIIEVPSGAADAAGKALGAAMVDAFTTLFPDAPTLGLCTLQTGRHWAEREPLA